MIEEARKHPNVMPLHKVEYSVATSSLIKPEPHKIGIFDKSMIHAVDPDFKERGGVKVQVTDLKDFSINLRLQVWFKDRSITHSSGCEIREAIIKPTFRRCPQENNIFLAIVFGYLLKSLKLLSQLKLPEIGVNSFH